MASMESGPVAGAATKTKTKEEPVARTPYMSWAAMAFITVASVASLRSAPTMAVYGLASVFLYGVAAIVFLFPTSFVSAELASGWSGASTAGSPRASTGRPAWSPSGTSTR